MITFLKSANGSNEVLVNSGAVLCGIVGADGMFCQIRGAMFPPGGASGDDLRKIAELCDKRKNALTKKQ